MGLNENPVLGVYRPEIPWGAASPGLEDPVEITQVVETAAVAYLADPGTGVDEHPGSFPKTDVDYEIGQGAAGVLAEEAAEGRGGHTHQRSHLIELYVIGVMY